MRSTILIYTFSLVLTNPLIANKLIVSSVKFEGNVHTNADLLKRVICTEEGVVLDSTVLETDVQKLKNLLVFHKVSYSVQVNNGRADVVFICNEVLTVLPIFNFGALGHHYFVQLGIRNMNWLGKSGYWKASYLYYDKHSLQFQAELPYIKKSNWGLSFQGGHFATMEPVRYKRKRVFYEYQNTGMELGLFYEFKQQHRAYFYVNIFDELFKLDDRQKMHQEGAPEVFGDTRVKIRLNHRRDHLDYDGPQLSGWSADNKLDYIASYKDRLPFFMTSHSFTYLKRINKRLNLGTRFKGGFSSNNWGVFAPFVLDSYSNIRGVGNKVDRGTGQLVVNVELRHLWFDRKLGAIQGVVFVDVGGWRMPGGHFGDFFNREFAKAYAGFGTRLYLRKLYNLILRVDLGVDVQDPGTHGVVLGFGQYF